MSSRMTIALVLLMAVPVAGQSAQTDSRAAPAQTAVPQHDASGAYHAGNGVLPPWVVHSKNPRFSKEARRKKISGTCTVSLIVDAEGNPQNVHIVRSVAEGLPADSRAAALSLDDSAIAAVKAYRLKPGTLNRKPVPVEITVEISYRIY